MRYGDISEEELKNRIATDFFPKFDCNRIIGKIDFCVAPKSIQKNKIDDYNTTDFFDHRQSFVWAEARKGKVDIYKSIVQLVLTIGKARTFDEHLPPLFLGAFDFERIAFIPYGDISEIFYRNYFNWNVTSSNQNNIEFKIILAEVKEILGQKSLIFELERDSKELLAFIAKNFVLGRDDLYKVKIDKNNLMAVYNKWLKKVKPSIALDWALMQKQGFIDGDFYLADLFFQDNKTLKEKLFVILEVNTHKLDRKTTDGLLSSKEAQFNDKQKAHAQFWNRYERPPREEYWDYIINYRYSFTEDGLKREFTTKLWEQAEAEAKKPIIMPDGTKRKGNNNASSVYGKLLQEAKEQGLL